MGVAVVRRFVGLFAVLALVFSGLVVTGGLAAASGATQNSAGASSGQAKVKKKKKKAKCKKTKKRKKCPTPAVPNPPVVAVPAPPPPPTVTALSAGDTHTCALRSNGQVWCWGNNDRGQLGNGSTTSSANPVRVGSDSDWASVSTGGNYSCGVRAGGQLWCWGAIDQMDVVQNYGAVPVRVGSASDWSSVSAGWQHACGVRAGGQLWCWGFNNSGQLGNGSTNNSGNPVRVGSASDWLSVSAGAFTHSCGLRAGGNVWCWGANDWAQLGVSNTNPSSVPVLVGSGFTSVAAGGYHSCGIRNGGQMWCWGTITNDDDDNFVMVVDYGFGPQRVGSASDWSSVAAGYLSACGLRSSGQIWCWGFNDYGQLGNGSTTNSANPVMVGSASDWSSISRVTNRTACGVRAGGQAWCWGMGDDGQLGNGAFTHSSVPVRAGL